MKFTTILLLLIASITHLSCSENKQAFDPKLAEKFLNEYAEFGTDSRKFVAKSLLVTKEFKSEYEKLHRDALKADPELGLDYDPIFNAQDWPDKGFEVDTYDEETGVVVLKAKDWSVPYKIEIRFIFTGNKWLIDGAGSFRD